MDDCDMHKHKTLDVRAARGTPSWRVDPPVVLILLSSPEVAVGKDTQITIPYPRACIETREQYLMSPERAPGPD